MIMRLHLAVILLGLAGLMSACSGISPATSPGINGLQAYGTIGQPESPRSLIGVWEVLFENGGVSASEASERVLLANPPHYNVKYFLKPPQCKDCIKFANLVDDKTAHVVSVDVTIKNPTTLTGADVRGIAMSSNPAVYLTNPDDYTTLFDTSTPPGINGFRLFGKDVPDGTIGGGGSATEHFSLHYDQWPFAITTAFDAVYPPDAKREPYEINNQVIAGNLDAGGAVTRKIECDILDRNNDTGLVSVTCPDLGISTNLSLDPGKANHYFGYVSNVAKAAAGDYKLLIAAADSVVPYVLYDYLTVTVADHVGAWNTSLKSFPNSGCPRDLSVFADSSSGSTLVYVPGASTCKQIGVTSLDFAAPTSYFDLENIDPVVPGFSPNPVNHLAMSILGGTAFSSSANATYTDAFYSGPISSLLICINQVSKVPTYIDPGDGDAGRMYPDDNTLQVANVGNDQLGDLYGLWGDPAGVLPPEIYGLATDYTRHDVFMGGAFPPDDRRKRKRQGFAQALRSQSLCGECPRSFLGFHLRSPIGRQQERYRYNFVHGRFRKENHLLCNDWHDRPWFG